MPLIIRCSVCDKPIGTLETPAIFSERYIEMHGDMIINGSYHQTLDGNMFSCSDECSKKISKEHPTPPFKIYDVITTTGKLG